MSFSEVDLFGVYVAPMSLMMAAAWFILVALRRLADHFGVMHQIWHPALFESAVYVTVLSGIVLIVGH